jgi:NADPH:quinone reductase-like Zn-dependent oxidoreductase
MAPMVRSPPRGKRRGARQWFGTAAQYTVVPTTLAIDLPDNISDEVGACLGITGITAHRAVFADGPVSGRTVLVHGVLGGVGAVAAQLAHRGGAAVIGTVRRSADLTQVTGAAGPHAVTHAIALDRPDAADAIRAYSPDGVDRIIEVAFSDNVDLDAAVAKTRPARRSVTSPLRDSLSGRPRRPAISRAGVTWTDSSTATADSDLGGRPGQPCPALSRRCGRVWSTCGGFPRCGWCRCVTASRSTGCEHRFRCSGRPA